LLQLALDAVAYHSVIAACAMSLGRPFGKAVQKLTRADFAITFMPASLLYSAFPTWKQAEVSRLGISAHRRLNEHHRIRDCGAAML
jgi:hypothetical protein